MEVFLGMENLAKNVRYNSGKNVYKNVDTLLKNQFQNCYFAFQKILFFQLTEALGFLYFICTVLTVRSAAPSDRTMGRLYGAPRFGPGTGSPQAGTLTPRPPHLRRHRIVVLG